MRILQLVHSHIKTSFGGSEHAAFALHDAYQFNQDAWILTPGVEELGDNSQRDRKLSSSSHPLKLIGNDAEERDRQLASLLQQIQPQVIHLHHYLHFGVDIITSLKNLRPEAKIVLTLHEYMLLCAHNGQMLKRGSNRTCNNPEPEACSNCFEGLDVSLFEQRNVAAQTALKGCDGLISPSHYLLSMMQQQFCLPADTRVIENGLPLELLNSYRQSRDETSNVTPSLNRFAFFGRASELKGLIVLLKACYLLSLNDTGLFQLQIFGGGLEQEPASIQHRIQTLIAACGDHIELHGRYRQMQIPQLMQQCDWVIVPSIWWENSPVVIQEAFACHKPVIGSNHGGIAEKINGRGGLGFQPNDAADLASRMAEAIGNVQLHCSLQKQMAPPFSIEACAAQHLEFFDDLMQDHACG